MGKPLFADRSAVAGLREFGTAGVDAHESAASACSQAYQVNNKQGRCTQADRFAVPLLPGAIGQRFQGKGISQGEDLMGELAMLSLARRCQFLVILAAHSLGSLLAMGYMPALRPALHSSFG